MPAAKRKPGRGGARPGAGRPVTTGSSVTAPVWYRVSASERERIVAACAPGESVNAAAKRLALMALAVYG